MFFDTFGDYVICDGAMGTMLQKSGLGPGERPDVMNMTAPQAVEKVHRMYLEAGSEIIITNTFGANAHALRATGYSPRDVIAKAVSLAKRACGGAAKVALDIGPIGALIEPFGDLGADEAYELFREQAVAGEEAGAHLAAIETMSDLSELEAAILAVTGNTALPVMATMTFDKSGRTYLGVSPEEFAETAERLGADAIGLNCSLAPAEMLETAERIAGASRLPIVIKPNAGLPDGTTGLYGIGPAEFALQMAQLANAVRNAGAAAGREVGAAHREGAVAAGAMAGGAAYRRRIIAGGCCGTSPEYIRELRKVFSI